MTYQHSTGERGCSKAGSKTTWQFHNRHPASFSRHLISHSVKRAVRQAWLSHWQDAIVSAMIVLSPHLRKPTDPFGSAIAITRDPKIQIYSKRKSSVSTNIRCSVNFTVSAEFFPPSKDPICSGEKPTLTMLSRFQRRKVFQCVYLQSAFRLCTMDAPIPNQVKSQTDCQTN